MSNRNVPRRPRSLRHLRNIYILMNELVIQLMFKYITEVPKGISVGENGIFMFRYKSTDIIRRLSIKRSRFDCNLFVHKTGSDYLGV